MVLSHLSMELPCSAGRPRPRTAGLSGRSWPC